MKQNQEVCVQCYQGITNPICEACHTKQLALWLNDYNVNPKIIAYIIRNIRKSFSLEALHDSPCIICSKEMVSICTYCYFFKVEKALRVLDLPEEAIEEFLQVFNYKLYHNVFSRDKD